MRKKRKNLLLVMASVITLSLFSPTGTNTLMANAAGNPNDDQINDRDPTAPELIESECNGLLGINN